MKIHELLDGIRAEVNLIRIEMAKNSVSLDVHMRRTETAEQGLKALTSAVDILRDEHRFWSRLFRVLSAFVAVASGAGLTALARHFLP